MCTAKELIVYLQTLPEDTEVEVLEECSRIWDLGVRWAALDIRGYSDNCNRYSNTLYLGYN